MMSVRNAAPITCLLGFASQSEIPTLAADVRKHLGTRKTLVVGRYELEDLPLPEYLRPLARRVAFEWYKREVGSTSTAELDDSKLDEYMPNQLELAYLTPGKGLNTHVEDYHVALADPAVLVLEGQVFWSIVCEFPSSDAATSSPPSPSSLVQQQVEVSFPCGSLTMFPRQQTLSSSTSTSSSTLSSSLSSSSQCCTAVSRNIQEKVTTDRFYMLPGGLAESVLSPTISSSSSSTSSSSSSSSCSSSSSTSTLFSLLPPLVKVAPLAHVDAVADSTIFTSSTSTYSSFSSSSTSSPFTSSASASGATDTVPTPEFSRSQAKKAKSKPSTNPVTYVNDHVVVMTREPLPSSLTTSSCSPSSASATTPESSTPITLNNAANPAAKYSLKRTHFTCIVFRRVDKTTVGQMKERAAMRLSQELQAGGGRGAAAGTSAAAQVSSTSALLTTTTAPEREAAAVADGGVTKQGLGRLSRAVAGTNAPLSTITSASSTSSSSSASPALSNKTEEEKTVDVASLDEEAASAFERTHVHQVYDSIAAHFSGTRHQPWPRVDQFVTELPAGSLLADIGCGNGKYLGINPNIKAVGCDMSTGLVNICQSRGYDAVVGNVLDIPFKSDTYDAVICVAVLPHLATFARRVAACRELVRILRPGGRLLVTAWALEQNESSKRVFEGQDVYVPWVTQASAAGTTATTQATKEKKKGKPGHGSKRLTEPETASTASIIATTTHAPTDSAAADAPTASAAATVVTAAEGKQAGSASDITTPPSSSSASSSSSSSSPSSSASSPADAAMQSTKTLHRFYHVFKAGEFEELFETLQRERKDQGLSDLVVVESFYSKGNWGILVQKK